MVAESANVARYRENRQAEVDAAMLYHTLAEAEARPEIAQVYRRMADMEAAHATTWEDHLRAADAKFPERKPSWRAKVMAMLARRLGPQAVLPTLVAQERTASSGYDDQAEVNATAMPGQERSHTRVLSTIAQNSYGMEGMAIARLEGRHRAIGGNALRAAVLGANDGLLSVFSLVMGVAGAQFRSREILLTGLAGLLAGAGSMALGEWLSVQSSRELYERQISIEEMEIEAHPQEEAQELALIYQAKGVPAPQAHEMAQRIMSDRPTAKDTMAREELGIDPQELGGSAWEAAGTSFMLFAMGAISPLLPFLFMDGHGAVLASVALSTVGLFAMGAGASLFTGKSVWFSGGRQVLFGLAAAALTFGVGRVLGVSVTG